MAEVRLDTPMGSVSARDGLTRLARLGYAVKGVVYLLIGGLALQAAWGGGNAEDTRGAMSSLLSQPFGRVMVALVAVGLAGYTMWRAYLAAANPEGDSARKRVFHAFIAVIHAGLTLAAVRMALNGRREDGDDSERAAGLTARVMEQPFGVWLVGGAGVAFGLYGLAQFRRAAKAKLDDQLDFSRLGARRRDWVERICRFGIAARGAVFLIIGWFLVATARQFDPTEARGLGGALTALRDRPWGAWLLTVAALGMAAYGVYQLVRARYRVIRTR
jgi:hypothetical protein